MANITERNGSFRIKISCGYTIEGKQVTKSTTYRPQSGMSESAIKKALAKAVADFEKQCKGGKDKKATKFAEYAKEWLADYAESNLKQMTLCSYRTKSKRSLAELGHIRIDRITKEDIKRFMRGMVDEGLALETIKGCVRFISVVLNHAVDDEILTINPCTGIKYPKAKKRAKERDFYTVEEVKNLLRLMQEERSTRKAYVLFYTLAAYSGCRTGELLGLRKSDINLDNQTISINQAYYYDTINKQHYYDTPKTHKSRRTLKLPANAINILKEYLEWQDNQREICGGSWVESNCLFTQLDGNPIKPYAPRKFFKDFCTRHGIRYVNTHSFRHFNASALINAGVDVVTVQAALGHSTPATTLSIYSHEFDNVQTRAMEAIANAINL
jgi:integrase